MKHTQCEIAAKIEIVKTRLDDLARAILEQTQMLAQIRQVLVMNSVSELDSRTLSEQVSEIPIELDKQTRAPQYGTNYVPQAPSARRPGPKEGRNTMSETIADEVHSILEEVRSIKQMLRDVRPVSLSLFEDDFTTSTAGWASRQDPECSGNPCTCGPNDIGRDDTEEEREFFNARAIKREARDV